MFDIIFGYADTYMPFVTLIIFLLLGNSIAKKDKSFLVYLLVNIILFAVTNIMALSSINNLFLYHFYYLFELIFVTWYFTTYLIKSRIPLFYIVISTYLLFWIIDVILWEPLTAFCSNAAAFQKILIIFQCMYFLFSLAKSEGILHFQRMPEFWITSAFLVSSALGVLAVVAYKAYEIMMMSASGVSTWLIEVIATMCKFIFLSIAFLCYKHRRSHSRSLSLL